MLEKWTKKFGTKATDSAIEGAKESLNDRLDKYSDIIEIGLVTLVIAWGGNKLIGHGRKQPQGYLPEGRQDFNGTPIVINNYYNQQERNPYRNQAKGVNYGREERKMGKKR